MKTVTELFRAGRSRGAPPLNAPTCVSRGHKDRSPVQTGLLAGIERHNLQNLSSKLSRSLKSTPAITLKGLARTENARTSGYENNSRWIASDSQDPNALTYSYKRGVHNEMSDTRTREKERVPNPLHMHSYRPLQ